MDDPGLDVALFRYRIIAPLLDEDLQPSQREQIIREITAKGYRIPNSSRTSVSRATVYRWFNAYKRDRLDGLRPKQRKDAGSCRAIPQHLLDKAIEARREAPYRSARKIVDILKATEQEVPPIALSTLHRHFQLAGCTRQELERAGKTWIRFQREHPNDLWQSDVMHSIYIHDPQMGKKRKTLLIGWIDDHSRLVPHAQFYFNEDLPALEDCLKKALLKRGIPKQIYADNGLIYRSNVLEAICAGLGARLSYTQPYSPEAKGKIEKFWDFVQSDFISEVQACGVRNLQELNETFWAWLEVVYHQKVHSETGKKPVDAFDTIGNRLILPDPIRLHELFLVRESRVVQPKTSTVSIKGILFEVDPSLRGKRVEVRYDPFDLTRVYIYHRSQRVQVARPFEMNQRPQPTPEKQLGGNQPPSINYLHLLKAQYDELILKQTKLIRYDQIEPSDDFTFQRFLALLANMLTRPIQDFDQEELAAAQDLWERFGPLEETICRIALEQAFNFRGYAQHISVYLDFIKIFHLKRRT